MDLEKLKEVITSEAKEEAEKLLKEVNKEAENYIKEEFAKINTSYSEKKDKINQEFSSKLSYAKFLIESAYRKNLLHTKHNLLEELRAFLEESFLEEIKKDPQRYVTYVLKLANIKDGTFLISSKLQNIITEETFTKSIKSLSLSSIEFGGIDNEIEDGVAIAFSNKKYIFSFSEVVNNFIDRNFQYINESFSLNEND